jgi:putative flavoprotein involved in K+ transport
VAADSRIGRRIQKADPLIGGSQRRLRRLGVRLVDRIIAGDGSRLRTASGAEVEASVVIWATGFRPDYGWLDIPGALSGGGRPEHQHGRSPIPGLYHLGLPFLRSRGSALIGWVGNDAAHLRDQLTAGQMELTGR